ncbi:putative repeat protein (TIGR03847 family) [Nocardioides aromaticivorans]|uniref:Putative repeat protein (TIGR03847 family) n=1 Tax=Nocardioides aromaticivorans TaxID=200618 RepID=A0A7Z0CR06_9ACTN|nr:DUF3090 domain-containing protein [Nocardioides aromaticivorans]NYI47357.1 putative repeat protein (TIGR03847 family) [Nocardioides aromaticivorans]QSR26484.1 hypothetical protein CFH99_12700 [Nocardioides aromaticivorans]
MPIVHGFDPPERFVAGTVGEPGSRTFFLQAVEGNRVVSVALEKQQVEALSERVDELLDEVIADGTARGVIPAIAPFGLADDAPLAQPIEEEFRAGTMTLSWDPGDERVVIEVFPVGEEPAELADGEEPAEMLLVRLEPGQARAFVKRAEAVVGAGRPSCPFCGQPIDPDGHLCVRANGFKRRQP